MAKQPDRIKKAVMAAVTTVVNEKFQAELQKELGKAGVEGIVGIEIHDVEPNLNTIRLTGAGMSMPRRFEVKVSEPWA